MAYNEAERDIERLKVQLRGGVWEYKKGINGKRIEYPALIGKANFKHVEEYVSFLEAKGRNSRTVVKNLYCLIKFFEAMKQLGLERLDLARAKRGDLQRIVAALEKSKMAAATKMDIKIVLKSLYKHILGEDEFFPEPIRWIKTSRNRSRNIMPEDILTEEDIMKLINGTNNLRDKAIVALLFDSGIRAGELMALRLKDISLDTQPAHIRVDGKTGQRKIPIWFSVPYLVQYLNTQKRLRDEDHIWREAYLPDSDKLGKEIDYSGVRNMLSLLKKKTGLNKRCNPHTFRHSRATFYANKLTEQQLKVFFGWTGDSRMAATYVHLSGRDIDNAILQANGMKPKEEDTKPKLSIQICQKCRMENAVTATFCSRCGAALDVSIAMKQIEKDRDLEEMGSKKMAGEDVEKDSLEETKGRRRTRK